MDRFKTVLQFETDVMVLKCNGRTLVARHAETLRKHRIWINFVASI